ncbi:GIY-YIG nuclease family protein [Comamonas thiooxydans]|uniref:GIY-YIG nuclease family protein n=1 Tax=Comamonas thiooxydans TaxID=363952 RepID=UPI000B412975|nr:GIY-YIG nuclease family protein [Comamonas thiooxydans]
MPVYFIRHGNTGPIKIGRASEVKRRIGQLQTGNPTTLQLLGWLVPSCDDAMERQLHLLYAEYRVRGEWFEIDQNHVLSQLQKHNGFVPKKGDAFEIVGYNRDGIPEYAGVCEWADFEIDECCPFCGCLCGMHQVSEYTVFSCTNCQSITDFSFLEQHHDDG